MHTKILFNFFFIILISNTKNFVQSTIQTGGSPSTNPCYTASSSFGNSTDPNPNSCGTNGGVWLQVPFGFEFKPKCAEIDSTVGCVNKSSTECCCITNSFEYGTPCDLQPTPGLCETQSHCLGAGTIFCPNTTLKANGTQCNTATDCSDDAYCNGISKDCPITFKPNNVKCRDSQGDCDVAEYCTGDQANCPSDSFLPQTTKCKNQTGPCDQDAYCDGSTPQCPSLFSPNTTKCRNQTGPCDQDAYCDGTTSVCSSNPLLPNTTKCGNQTGPCDRDAYCDGTTSVCNPNPLLPNTTKCRNQTGPCDQDAYCDGLQSECPPNTFLLPTNMCRSISGPCDSAEYCTGNSSACPVDIYQPITTICRPKNDSCDVDDYCNGISPLCTTNIRRDYSYFFKCAKNVYFCGVKPEELTFKKGVVILGGTVIGAYDKLFSLTWPSCLYKCLPKICPNDKEMSNYGEAACILTSDLYSTLKWNGTLKMEISNSTSFPICPSFLPNLTPLTAWSLLSASSFSTQIMSSYATFLSPAYSLFYLIFTYFCVTKML